MNEVLKQAVERVRALAKMVDSGNYDEIVTQPDGTHEGFVVVNGERRPVFSTGADAFFDPTPVLEEHDRGGDGPAVRPGQLAQLRNLRYPGPMPRGEQGASALLEFWQVYYANVVRRRLSPTPTRGQLLALANFGYDGPTPATRDEAKRLLAEIQNVRRRAKAA